MAWTNPIDPTKPANTDPASQGDDQIRQLKAGLLERLGSILPGWPTADPLFVKAGGTGTLAQRPAAPSVDGQRYIVHPGGQEYYGSGGAWYLLSTGTPGQPTAEAPPTGFTVDENSSCAAAVPTYLQILDWTVANATSQTQVLVNGVVVATKAANIDTHSLMQPPGTYQIGIRHLTPTGLLSDTVTQTITVVSPCVTAPDTLAYFQVFNISTCTAGPVSNYIARFDFIRGNAAGGIRIRRNGVEIAGLAPEVQSPYTHVFSAPIIGVSTFEATQIVSGVEGPPSVRQVSFVDPCTVAPISPPINLDIQEFGLCVGAVSQNEAYMSWENVHPTYQTRVYKAVGGGAPALLTTLAAGLTSYIDEDVFMETTYHYYLTHYNPAVPEESFESGSLHYVGVDLCPEE